MRPGDEIERLLSDLTPAQRAAVTSEAAPLCILASAGAGKTRVLTRRIAYRTVAGTADAGHTLALTFTRKAAGELQTRLQALDFRERVAAGTFHALASAQMHRWWADRQQPPPVLLDRKSRLLARLSAGRPGLAQVPLADLAGVIEWAKARMISPDRLEAEMGAEGRRLPPAVSPAAVAALYARYEDEKARRGLVDFDDLLSQCADAIERDPAFAGAQRWRWRHVFVDEFQDLNPLQHRLLLAWLGSSTDLCVVGDPNQAIYGWNGGDHHFLVDMPRRWPSTEVLHLDANHRCSPQIVAAAAAVLGPAAGHLTSAGEDGPAPEVRAYPSENGEASGIATGLRRAHAAGRRWSSMAVLARTNAQLVPIHQALAAAGIPCWTPVQSGLLADPTARQFLNELRRKPHLPIQAVAADLEAMATEASSSAGGDDEGTVLSALADLARTLIDQDPASTAREWMDWLPAALRESTDRSERSEAVALCSFHRAKGLEWDVVWVAGLEQGLVPIGRATSAEAKDEERRLLYVALTRAGAEVHCSWSRQRTFGSRSVPREPSPWLALLVGPVPGESDAPLAGESSEAWRQRLREHRRRLREGAVVRRRGLGPRFPEQWPLPDPDLVQAIKAWRSETARASGVPAYVVLHDVTVQALAALRPRTTAELLAVPGLGPVKAGRYGAGLLALVADQAATA